VTPANLAIKHLRSRPIRTALTVFALAFCVGLIGFLLLMKGALEKDWSPNMARRAIVTAQTSMFERLPMAYLGKIADTPGVKEVIPFDFLMGFVGDNRPENQIPIGAAPPEGLLRVYMEADVPEDQQRAYIADRRGALIGELLAKKYGWKIGDKKVLKAPVNGGVIEVTVRAIMRYDLDNSVYIHRKYLEGLLGDDSLTGMFWILANSREDVQPITAAVDAKFVNAPVPIRAMTEKGWQLQWMQMMGNVQALIGSIGLVTGFAVLLVTGNTLSMTARERRGEAALLRILGFSRGSVARLLMLEACFYGLLGAVFGCVLMMIFAKLIGMALAGTMYEGIAVLVKPDAPSALFAFTTAIVLAVLAGVIPAFGLSRRSIVQLLREG